MSSDSIDVGDLKCSQQLGDLRVESEHEACDFFIRPDRLSSRHQQGASERDR